MSGIANSASERDLPDAAFAVALSMLPDLGARRLRTLLEGGPARDVWASVREGRVFDPGATWQERAMIIDAARSWEAHRRCGISVFVLGDDRYPAALASDPEAPGVLFALGDIEVLAGGQRCAIVGTRAATRYGLSVAAQFGAELTGSGIAVVSGLASGIDGAAHEGACAVWTLGASKDSGRDSGMSSGVGRAAPIAVVAGGLDSPYPRANARLWARVAQVGVILSESPIGASVPRWRFPQRNRILAALSDVVVVVECHQTGGSLHTVKAAVRRGISVGAVPGSIRSPASVGTNDLIADGCFVVREMADVRTALALAGAHIVPVRTRHRRSRATRQVGVGESGVVEPGVESAVTTASGQGNLLHPEFMSSDASSVSSEWDGLAGLLSNREWSASNRIKPEHGAEVDITGVDRTVLEAIGWEPCSMEELLRRTNIALASASLSLQRLQQAGLIDGDGGWWERR